MNDPILSILVPIYNRSIYLERMLKNFLMDKDLFQTKVNLYISDNCSTEDLQAIVHRYILEGLKIIYHRNNRNIGGDNNIISCYQSGNGKYILVLGSDDIMKVGRIREIVNILDKEELGLLHLNHHCTKPEGFVLYNNHELFLSEINIWITFISSNIVKRDYINQVDFEKYRDTNFSQVVLFVLAASKERYNGMLSRDFFEKENESASNGGYNLFQVFIVNLLSILNEAVHQQLISKECYQLIKKRNFVEFLSGDVARRLILRKRTNHETKDAWRIVWKYYGKYFYFYTSTLKELIRTCVRKIRLIK